MFIILIFSFFRLLTNKNIFFPFKKITIEYFNETKTISDFIDFNIYTNITMGTPPKKVAHFIYKRNILFSYRELQLRRYSSPYDKQIEEQLEKSFGFFYNSNYSSTFEKVAHSYAVYSDIFYFNDLVQKEAKFKLEFNMLPETKNKRTCGAIDIYNTIHPGDTICRYLFQVFKDSGVIDDYYSTFFYGEYSLDDNFTYFNDDYDEVLGYLILGESPHELYPEKYKKNDEIKIDGHFSINIDEIKFKSKFSNYTENDILINFNFTSEFIRGSNKFKEEIDNIFFIDLLTKNICTIDIVEENIYTRSKDLVYSCNNSEILKEKVKNFPTLYLGIKQYNLTFLFNYKELFKLYNKRLYFLILFKNDSSTNWDFGDLFLRKYTTSFNYDSKTVSLYKQQVKEINNKTDIPEPYPENDKGEPDGKNDYNLRLIFEIIMGSLLLLAIVVIIIFWIKIKKSKKKRAAELKEDEDYEYIPEGIIN